LLLQWSDKEAECVEAAAECNNDVAQERGQHDAVASEWPPHVRGQRLASCDAACTAPASDLISLAREAGARYGIKVFGVPDLE
jgi:hypothetical protein